MAIVFGFSCLPHIMVRFCTVPSAREARRSVVWITWTMIVFHLATVVLGFAATALVGSDAITDFHFFPLTNPGIVSIPLALPAGVAGDLHGAARTGTRPSRRSRRCVR